MCWCRSWHHTCILPSTELYARGYHVTVSYTVNSPTRVRYSSKNILELTHNNVLIGTFLPMVDRLAV